MHIIDKLSKTSRKSNRIS